MRLLTVLSIVLSINALAQEPEENLVPNWSFDEGVKKIKEGGSIEMAIGWSSPTEAKADLFSKTNKGELWCAGNDKVNKRGKEQPNDGDIMAGIVMFGYRNARARSYLQTELKEKLDVNRNYCVKFHVSLSDLSRFACNGIGLALSDAPFTEKMINDNKIVPQIKHSKDRIFQEQYTWEAICQVYKAKGGEKHLIIGDFTKTDEMLTIKMRKPRGFYNAQSQDAYYFIENVSVVPMDQVQSCVCEKEDRETQVVYRRNFSENTQLFPEKAIEHKRVFFELRSSAVSSTNNSILDGVVRIMKDNPNVNIQVAGHTDVQEESAAGGDMGLSEKRAKNVYFYLVAKGVEENRMTYIGKNDTQPASQNQSTASRAQNRRVDFKIIE